MSFGNLTRNQRRAIARRVSSWPEKLTPIPREEWPTQLNNAQEQPMRALRSRDFICLVYDYGGAGPNVRLSICRTSMRADGHYVDGITWDELQQLKAEAGYSNRWAVEVYPPAHEVVNVANMRHLWLLDDERIGWRRDP